MVGLQGLLESSRGWGSIYPNLRFIPNNEFVGKKKEFTNIILRPSQLMRCNHASRLPQSQSILLIYPPGRAMLFMLNKLTIIIEFSPTPTANMNVFFNVFICCFIFPAIFCSARDIGAIFWWNQLICRKENRFCTRVLLRVRSRFRSNWRNSNIHFDNCWVITSEKYFLKLQFK